MTIISPNFHTDRITVPETPRFTFDVARDIEKADADIKAYIQGQPEGSFDAVTRQQTIVFSKTSFNQPRSSWADFRKYFGQWRNGSLLFATMASWFFGMLRAALISLSSSDPSFKVSSSKRRK
jgi:PHS family inorganic phosphate transporter-like MFS transporter